MAAAPDISAYQETALFLATAGVVVPLLQRLKLSPVLGFLLAGVALGPFGLGRFADALPGLGLLTIRRAEQIAPLADFGVALLLFMIGLELSWERLLRMRRWVFGLGGAQVVVCTALLAAGAVIAGQPLAAALLLGAGLALSPTAVVTSVLGERGETQTRGARVALSVLLFQDLAVAPILAALPFLAHAGKGGSPTAVISAIAWAVLGVLLIVICGRLVLRPLMHLVARTRQREFFMAACLLVILATGLAAAAAGLSMALGAFLAGLLLSETEYRRQVEVAIDPFRRLFLGLFFLTIGVALDLSVLARAPLAVLGVAGTLVLIKAPVTAGLARLFGAPVPAALRAGLVLAPAGEFAFVLLGAATPLGLIPQEAARIAVAGVTLSLFLTPLLAALGARLARRTTPLETAPDPPELSETEVPRVLIVGYGRVGRLVGEMLEAHDQPFLALDSDAGLAARASREGRPVYWGDAADPDLLVRCGIDRAPALVVTLDSPEAAEAVVIAARALRPDLTLVARARDAAHAARLYELGATDAVPETVEASLQLAENTLLDIGKPAGFVIASIHERREQYRELFRKSSTHGREPRAVRRTIARRGEAS
jgi:CPA2 family monovalent cation:H+ antiporter-2